MTTTATGHNPTAADLRTIIRHWDDLRAMLETPNVATWPPSGLANYLAALDDDAHEEYRAEQRAEHADRTAIAMGERPVPLRLAILDTIRDIDASLVALADQVASAVQRPAHPARPSAGPGDNIGQAMRLAALQDEADPRRWRQTGAPAADEHRPQTRPAGRTGTAAARWLIARIEGQAGPFRQLRPTELARIASEARSILARVERALKVGRRTDPIPLPCPCGGKLVMHHGGELAAELAKVCTWGSVLEPEAKCLQCGTGWKGPMLAKLLEDRDQAA